MPKKTIVKRRKGTAMERFVISRTPGGSNASKKKPKRGY
jgi:hypothetical protein